MGVYVMVGVKVNVGVRLGVKVAVGVRVMVGVNVGVRDEVGVAVDGGPMYSTSMERKSTYPPDAVRDQERHPDGTAIAILTNPGSPEPVRKYHVSASVGLMLFDLTTRLGMTPQEQAQVLGDQLFFDALRKVNGNSI